MCWIIIIDFYHFKKSVSGQSDCPLQLNQNDFKNMLPWCKAFHIHVLSLLGKGAETTERGSAGHAGETSPLQLGH